MGSLIGDIKNKQTNKQIMIFTFLVKSMLTA